MRKLFSLLAAVLFAGSMMAGDVEATFTGSTMPSSQWTAAGAGSTKFADNTACLKISSGSDNYLQYEFSSAFDLESIDFVFAFGSKNVLNADITCYDANGDVIKEAVLTQTAQSGSNVKQDANVSIKTNGVKKFKIGNTTEKNLLIGKIVFKEAAAPTKTVYLKPGTTTWGNTAYIYDVTNEKMSDEPMTVGTGCMTGYFYGEVPANCETVIFSKTSDWSGDIPKQTVDFSLAEHNLLELQGVGEYGEAGGKYYGNWFNYEAPVFTITLNDNGADGGDAMTNPTVDCGGDVKLPKMTRTKTDFVFSGWKNVEAGHTFADEATIENIGSSFTLTAQWEKVLGEIVKVTADGGSNKTVNVNKIGATFDVNLSSGKKVDSGKYFGIVGAFKAGDVVNVNIATAAGSGSTMMIFDAKEANDDHLIYNAGNAGTTGDNTFTLSQDVDALWIYRDNTYCTWNPVLNFISVTRHGDVVSTSYANKLIVNDVKTSATATENVITLAGPFATIPTVMAVKATKYEDGSTVESNINVNMTEGEGVFTGTFEIGTTEYTVNATKSSDPVLELSENSGSISLKSYQPTGVVKVTLTGANLTDGEYNAPTAQGIAVSPATFTVAEGIVNQEFTITATLAEAPVTTNALVFAVGEQKSVTYTLTFNGTAQRTLEQVTISEETTWDWTKAGNENVQLAETTAPTKSEEFLLSNLAEINNNANFNSQALKVVTEYACRDKKYMQGNVVKFTTSVAGQVSVVFSNTGNREDTPVNRRYLYINGENTNAFTLRSDADVTVTNYDVEAGEVLINAFTGEETPAPTMIRIKKIIFTPKTTYTHNFADHDLYTLYLDYNAAIPEGVKAYYTTTNYGTFIEIAEIEDGVIPAKTGVLILLAEEEAIGEKEFAETTATSTTEFSTNALRGVLEDTEYSTLGSILTLNTYNEIVGFYLPNPNNTVLKANRCYLPMGENAAVRIVMPGQPNNPNVTGVEEASAAKATKALVNGKLVIVRGAKAFDAKGNMLK